MPGALSIIPVMGCLVLGTVAVPGRYGTGLFPRRSEREHEKFGIGEEFG